MRVSLSIASDLHALLQVGLVRAEPVAVGAASVALDSEIERVCSDLAAKHAGRPPSEIPGLAPARELYRAVGIDPTRTRPSSEALVRRVVAGKPIPHILNAVDVCNLCSLTLLLPIGLYDAARIRGPITLRRGRAGEAYEGIRKDRVNLENRPALADEEGPFGNPTSDSLRTSVTLDTTSLLMVIFAPAKFSRAALEEDVKAAREAIARHLAPAGAIVSTESVIHPNA